MLQSTNGLSIIANKSPVVATHVGSFDDVNVERTLQRYNHEVQTYVRPAAIDTYQQRFLQKILNQEAAIGCIVAPFGYGKTSTAIDTWKLCEAHRLLAVPPFSCGSIAEMGQAIATGVAHQLDKVKAVQVQAAYESYLASSAQRLAEQDASQYQINFETALRSIEDKIERGYLQLEATGNHLLIFLEQLTQIVVDSGYRGLLVTVDEFQQFLGNINKAVVTNFRTLVWGLRTRGRMPFGLLITMDPDTERNLNERAGDIMHRIKEDHFYLDFADVYDREFARLLWTRYSETLGFASESSQVVDRPTLDAIGQISERHDLSNGPRTVIDLFQRIATLYLTRQHAYSPLDMIDDFMTGDIRFDGNQRKIASLVTELTSYDYIRRVPERLQALKLIAAFPRGCPREVAVRYGVATSFDELADLLRGEVLTELPEGIALIDLQRVGKPQNKLNIILKKYWMQITEDEIIVERAVKLFGQYVIPQLFPPYRNLLAGWSAENAEFELTAAGSYQQTYIGTFFEEYPQRRVCVQVCRTVDEIAPVRNHTDVQFVFLLQRSDEPLQQAQYDAEQHTFILPLVINRPFGTPLPRDVRWIEEYLRPVVMSPGVLLSLLAYIESQSPTIDGITENELTRIETHLQKLKAFLVASVFGEERFAGLNLHIIARGEQAMREVLFSTLRTAYPTYATLITSPQWESTLRSYLGALQSVTPLHSRGIEPLAEAKAALAGRFGLRNHASFESHLKQLTHLATLVTWSGDQGVIQFKRHPVEDLLLNAVVLQQGATEHALLAAGEEQGYLPVEIRYGLELLLARGHLQQETHRHRYLPAQTISVAELKILAQEIKTEAQQLQKFITLPTLQTILAQLDNVTHQWDSNDLTEIQVRLVQAQRALQQVRPTVLKQIQGELLKLRSKLYEQKDTLTRPLVLSTTGLTLDTHVNGAQRILTARCEASSRMITKQVDEVARALQCPVELENKDALQSWLTTFATIRTQIDEQQQQVDELLLLCHRHETWVHLVAQIKKITEYIKLLQEFTDTSSFEREYNKLLTIAMDGLAVEGLAHYHELADLLTPRVNRLLDEINIALQAQRLQQLRKSEGSPEGPPSVPSEPYLSSGEQSEVAVQTALLTLASEQGMTLTKLLQHSTLSPQQLQSLLLSLEAAGAIQINFTVLARVR